MRPLWPLLGLVFLTACAAPFGEAERTPLADAESGYVSLYSGIPGFFGLTASAVIIAPGIAVTNAHVVRATDHLGGYMRGRGLVGVEVLAISDRMDLAFLRIPAGIGTPVTMAMPVKGQRVWAMGTTNIFNSPVAQGTLLSDHGWTCAAGSDDPASCRRVYGLMYAAPVAHGYSGGPVVDAHGALIGITQGLYVRLLTRSGREVRPPGTLAFAYSAQEVVEEADRLLGYAVAAREHK